MVARVMLGERTGKGQFLRDKYDCVSLTHWERVVVIASTHDYSRSGHEREAGELP